ncbi:hypothetical protein DFQ26_000839 [Actinomortierella ambigua]|nr:hypothetical protein DFQ26_000839 [Actinomortierella ambigua]
MNVDIVHRRVSPGRSSSSPSPSYPVITSSTSKDPTPSHFAGSESSSLTHRSVSQVASSMQFAQSSAATTSPSPSGPTSPHPGQIGPQRSQKQRPILPFANPHVSRARSTSSGSSSSSSASRPPVPPPTQPAMASLSQGPSRNHPNRNNGPRRASYSHDPPNSTSSTNSNTPRTNRPPSPLPLIITLSSSSIRARKNALEMDNIQRASLLYTDFMARVKESLTKTKQLNQQEPSPSDGAQSMEEGATDDTTSTPKPAPIPSSTTAAAVITTTYLGSTQPDDHGDRETEFFPSLPAPTIGFDPTAEAMVALEDLAKTGMLHAMIQRYFEWIHPQLMIFNKNQFLLRFWSQFGPFPEARELHAKLHNSLQRESEPSLMPGLSPFTPGPGMGFVSERTCPLSPLLLWSMVALVARHIDDRESLKTPIQKSHKRIREGLALLNLQEQMNPQEDATGDVVMADGTESSQEDDGDKPAEIGANKTPEDYKDRGEQYFRWATELLKEQHAESSLVVVQSLLLLREYAVMTGFNSQATMYAGTAITMAMDLGWHKLARPVTTKLTPTASSSTSATSIHSSESTTSIATMDSMMVDPPGLSWPVTPSDSSVSPASKGCSSTAIATGSVSLSESSGSSTGTTSVISPAATTPAMVAAVAPSTPAALDQSKEQQVAEEEQRLCWGMCFIIDRWAAISTGRPFAIPIHVVDKDVFLTTSTPAPQKKKSQGDSAEGSPTVKMPGLQMRTKQFYEQQCRQALVIDGIQQFLMTWTEDLFVNTNSFDRLATALESWYHALPSWMTMSSESGTPVPSADADATKPSSNASLEQGESATPSLPDIVRNLEWTGSTKGPEARQLESMNKDISLAIIMEISYHTVRILLHRPFLRTNLRHPPCSPSRASYACAQSANAITGYAEQLLNRTALSPSLLMRHLFSMLTAAGIQLTNANLEDEPRLSTPAKINLLKSIRVLRDSDRTSMGLERFIAILGEFFPVQMKLMYKRA